MCLQHPLVEGSNDNKQVNIDPLFTDNYEQLVTFAKTIVHEEGIAIGIVADVYLKLKNTGTNLRQVSNLEAFIYVCVRNACYDYFRNKGPEMPVDFSEELPALDHTTKKEESAIIEAEVIDLILKNLPKLPEKDIAIAIGILLQKRTVKEVAEKVGEKPHKVNYRIKIIMNWFKNILRSKGFTKCFIYFL